MNLFVNNEIKLSLPSLVLGLDKRPNVAILNQFCASFFCVVCAFANYVYDHALEHPGTSYDIEQASAHPIWVVAVKVHMK